MTVGEYKDQLPAEFLKPQYVWWRKALARNRLPVNYEGVDDMRCGLYRWGNRAVAIWQTGGAKGQGIKVETHVAYNGVEQFTINVLEDWPKICKEPVTPQAYRECMDAGWKWPIIKERAATNAPPPDASPELLQSKLDELERDAKRLIDKGAAKTQDSADEAARVADLIASVGKAAIDRHRHEKEPHLAAGRAVDRIWFPVRDRADEIKRLLKNVVVTPFLRAEEQRLIVESAAMIQAGIDPEAITGKTAKASGGTRTTALRTITSAEVTDYGVLWTSLRDHPQVVELIHDIATRSARAGIELPGTKIIKIRSAV